MWGFARTLGNQNEYVTVPHLKGFKAIRETAV